jgi:uncharacterized membrane protein YkoI
MKKMSLSREPKTRRQEKKVKIIYHLNESSTKINKDQAIDITKRFLEQHHNVSGASAVLRKEKWFVTMYVSMSNNDTRQVRIDANTGRILDYT